MNSCGSGLGLPAGRTQRTGIGFGSPELWLRRWRTVAVPLGNPGTKPATGASRSSAPRSANWTTAVAVTIFVIENQR